MSIQAIFFIASFAIFFIVFYYLIRPRLSDIYSKLPDIWRGLLVGYRINILIFVLLPTALVYVIFGFFLNWF